MGKTWFITGSSSGIGLGIAKAVLAQGDNAVVMARSAAKLESLDEIEKWADVSARSDFFPICSTRHCG